MSEAPVFICSNKEIERDRLAMEQVKSALIQLQFGETALVDRIPTSRPSRSSVQPF
jgi:hypothetical protein